MDRGHVNTAVNRRCGNKAESCKSFAKDARKKSKNQPIRISDHKKFAYAGFAYTSFHRRFAGPFDVSSLADFCLSLPASAAAAAESAS